MKNEQLQGLSDARARLLMKMMRGEAAGAVQPDAGAVPPLAARAGGAAEPASFAQERLWFLDQLDVPAATYTVPGMVRLRGPLEHATLEGALLALCARHESLRTRFERTAEALLQVCDPAPERLLESEDLSALDAGARDAALAGHVDELMGRRFDLARGPLLRAKLVRIDQAEHLLLIVMHHIVSDGWSMSVFVRELAAFYGAALAGDGAGAQAAGLAPLALQYADYALWQRQAMERPASENELAYWRTTLAGAAVLELPTDRPRPAAQHFAGAQHTLSLGAPLTARLNALAREQGVTLFMVLLAGFNAVLARWSGQDDIVVGTPLAGRTRAELESLIGLFVNSVALRTDVSGDPDFRTLIERARQATVGAYAHQETPFERVVQELKLERDGSRQPLFQVRIVLQNTPEIALSLAGLELTEVPLQTNTSKYDLTLYLKQGALGLEGHIEYATGLYDAATIARLAQWYQQLLGAAAMQPEAPLSTLSMLDAHGRATLADDWSGRLVRGADSASTLHALIAAQARLVPDAPAVICGAQRLSYQELDQRSNRLAHFLIGLGVVPETAVGLLLERSIDLVVAMLAVLKTGAAYVPLEPSNPPARLGYMLQDAGALVVLCAPGAADPPLPGVSARMICLEAHAADIALFPAVQPALAVSPDMLAYIIYTSGSTGAPKGVMVAHRTVVNYLGWAGKMVRDQKIGGSVVHSPISFDLTVTSFFPPLVSGGHVTLLAPGERIDEVGALADALASRKPVGLIKLTPSHLSAIHTLLDERLEQACINTVVAGGEAMTAAVMRPWLAAMPNTAFFNHYGPTEATVGTCVYRLPRTVRPNAVIPIGKPIPGAQVYVLDRHLELCAPGVVGELYIGGAGLARGYRGRPALTADTFIPNPFGAGDRLYRTGDRARWRDDGNLEYLGRRDHQVKLRGYRIELGEIEAVLARQSGVRQAAVAIKGVDAERRLVAYVVLAEDAVLDPAGLRRAARNSLPDYMIPSAVVQLEALPLTPNGKLDRNALAEPAAERGSDLVFVAPQPGTETRLAAIWCDLLKVERVGAGDSFFDLGGHSLLATTMVARIRQAFGVDLSLRVLFEAPSLAQIAARIEALPQGAASAMPAVTRLARGAAAPR